jgi:hypothetical protein
MNDRPGKLFLGILGALVLLLVIGSMFARSPSHLEAAPDSGKPPSTTAQVITGLVNPVPTPPTPPTPRTEIQGQDHYNFTRRFHAYERQQQLTRPAYQHLPYRTSNVRINITDVTSDGRIVLTVTPLSPNVSPKTEYQRFLARYHDPGAAYLPLFARFGK